MRKYSIVSLLIVLALMIVPVIALSSITNLPILALSSNTGPDMNVYLYQGPLLSGDTYDFGNCTYWVYLLRAQIGEEIPTNWGNAITWADRAKNDGYLVDQTPTYGAIMQDPNAPGGLGHVAFVESVADNGTWTISEMNRVGFDEVDTRMMSASSAASYYFIHDK